MNSRNVSLIVVALLAPAALWFWMQYCGAKMLDTDYATLGGPAMFQRVIGFSPPKGLEVVKVAGHHGPGTGMIWFKLTGNNRSLDALTSNMVSMDKGFRYSIPTGVFGVQKTFAADAHDAGWDEVPNVSKPEVYIFRTAKGPEQWDGTVVLARASHTAYISGSLVKSG